MEAQKDIGKIKNKFEAALQFQTEVMRFFHIQFLSSTRLWISYTKKIDRFSLVNFLAKDKNIKSEELLIS